LNLEKNPIVDFKASNLRSQVTLADGRIYHWGGFFYENYYKLAIDGFNLLQDEKSIPNDVDIV
jgi:hypothetical protein